MLSTVLMALMALSATAIPNRGIRPQSSRRHFVFGETSVGYDSLSPAARRLYDGYNGQEKRHAYARQERRAAAAGEEEDRLGQYPDSPQQTHSARAVTLKRAPPLTPASLVPSSQSSFEDASPPAGGFDHLLKGGQVRAGPAPLPGDGSDDTAPMEQFLKRGLTLLEERNDVNSFESGFMETHRRFLANLLQTTPNAIPDIAPKWQSRSGDRSYRTDRLYTKWKSVDCGVLDMRLKMVGSIYEGHRNRVIKLYDRNSRQTFAYKTYGNPDEFYAELEMFLWLDHPYFTKAVCHRKDTDTGKAGILFEFVQGQSSLEYARTASPEQLRTISAQLFLAMEHLHWLGVVHADLKPENVLIRSDGTVQVIDLGFAIHLPQAKRRRGTHTTMAPELHSLVPGKCHEALDWWAYGSTVAMWYGVNDNFRNNDGVRFIAMDWRETRFIAGSVPWRFPPELRSFLHIFFQPHPEQRKLNSKRLLKQLRLHPFFDGLDWSTLVGGIMN